MKRVLFLPLFLIVLFACKRNEMTDVDAGKVPSTVTKKPVTFSIADFLSHEEDLRKARKVEKDGISGAREDSARISYFYYLAYDSNGIRRNYQSQDSIRNPNDFGTISDSLEPGKYTIILVASEKLLHSLPLFDAPNYGYIIQRYPAEPLGQIFVKKMQLTIDTTPNPTRLEVTLQRIVGQLMVEITDALPIPDPNGETIVEVLHAPSQYLLGTEMPGPPSTYNNGPYSQRIDQTHFHQYLIGSDYDLTVVIKYYNKNTGTVELTKTIEHVTCRPNKKTIITGRLYEAPQPNKPGIDIKLDQSWDTDATVIYF